MIPENVQFLIALKPDQVDGLIAIIPGETLNHYFLLVLEKGRVSLRLHQGDEHTNAESREGSAVVGEWLEIVVARNEEEVYIQVNGDEKKYVPSISEKIRVQCTDNILIGALPAEIKVHRD